LHRRRVEGPRFARDAGDAQAVAAIRSDREIDHAIVEVKPHAQIASDLRVGGQLDDAARVLAEPELARGAEHALRSHAAELAALDLQPSRERRAFERERRAHASVHVRRAADDLELVSAAVVHAAYAQLVGVRVTLHVQHRADDDVVERGRRALDALELVPGKSQALAELRRRRRRIHPLAQPRLAQLHVASRRAHRNCSRKRRSFSKKSRRSFT
jgi:hypothetical protein